MRKFILTIIIFNFIASISANDYFDHCTTGSGGRIVRFDQNPITVFVDQIPSSKSIAESYQNVLTDVIEIWENGSDPKIKFELTEIENSAKIRIFWTHQRNTFRKNIGEATLINDPKNFYVNIEIFMRKSITLELISENELRSVLLHELGHAIGLWGHSTDENDAMFPTPIAQTLSQRDLATFRKIYETPIGTPFHSQAIEILKSEIEKYPDRPENYESLGTIQIELGKYDDAIRTFQTALALDPLSQLTTLKMADLFQQNDNLDMAIRYYRKIADRNRSAEIFGALGTLHLLNENFSESIRFLKRASLGDPNSKTFRQNLLAAFHRSGFKDLKNGEFQSAIDQFNKGLIHFPNSEILLYDLATAHASANEFESAMKFYNRLLDQFPKNKSARIGMATAFNNIGAQFSIAEDWSEAIDFYRQSLRYDEACWEAKRNLIDALMRLGWEKNLQKFYGGAIANYQEALAIEPEDPFLHNNIAIVYFNQRDFESALLHLEKAIELDPNYADAKSNLAYIEKQHSFDQLKSAAIPVSVGLLMAFLVYGYNTYRKIPKTSAEERLDRIRRRTKKIW